MESRRYISKKFIGILIALVLAAYTVLVYVLVSAALVPDFMRKLDAFQKITDKSYAEQVQTVEVQDNHKQALSEMEQWYQDVPRQRVMGATSEGYHLMAMEFLRPEQEESHRWVLILHGYTGWKEAMYEFAKWYYEQGYHVIVPDMRCQGQSEGDFIGMGYIDSRDCQIWLSYMLRKDPEAEIVLHGQSMGAATALMMADSDICRETIKKGVLEKDGTITGTMDLDVTANYSHIKAVVSDSSYTDAYSMFGEKITEWFHLPPFPLVDSAVLMLKLRGGYDLHRASALDAVKRTTIPLLFIHGTEDAMISVDMAYRLYEAAAGPKRLCIVEGAGHAQNQDADPEGFYSTIREFLNGVDSPQQF